MNANVNRLQRLADLGDEAACRALLRARTRRNEAAHVEGVQAEHVRRLLFVLGPHTYSSRRHFSPASGQQVWLRRWVYDAVDLEIAFGSVGQGAVHLLSVCPCDYPQTRPGRIVRLDPEQVLEWLTEFGWPCSNCYTNIERIHYEHPTPLPFDGRCRVCGRSACSRGEYTGVTSYYGARKHCLLTCAVCGFESKVSFPADADSPLEERYRRALNLLFSMCPEWTDTWEVPDGKQHTL